MYSILITIRSVFTNRSSRLKKYALLLLMEQLSRFEFHYKPEIEVLHMYRFNLDDISIGIPWSKPILIVIYAILPMYASQPFIHWQKANTLSVFAQNIIRAVPEFLHLKFAQFFLFLSYISIFSRKFSFFQPIISLCCPN